MELYSIIDNFHPLTDEKLLQKAEELKPVLYKEQVRPCRIFREENPAGSCERALEIQPDQLDQCELGKGDRLCFDFGKHCVGYLKLSLAGKGSHQDAPAYIRLKFAERTEELRSSSSDYSGWLSSGWIQEEYLHIDDLPSVVEPGRRFAFRYLEISVLDTSRKYRLAVTDILCETETSAEPKQIRSLQTGDERMNRIYEVGVNTLKSCMQDVFEDGPKRDRRLWIGDLRLEALSSYAAIPNYGLVKRCLYLFAGSRFPDGRVSAAIFTDPVPEADDTWFFDYSLLYVVTLEEYIGETGDTETLNDLYPIAMQQIDLAASKLDHGVCVNDEQAGSTFIDWCEGLEKKAAAQAILIYATDYAIRLARRKEDAFREEALIALRERVKEKAELFWDPAAGCYLSDGQRSAATQVWMVLAGVPDKNRAKALMESVLTWNQEPGMKTPYMQHYFVTALIKAGLRREAQEHMTRYWGTMVDAGADTYYEIWDPENPDNSPYGGREVLSYCHAWSCTPVWLIRNYFS